VLVLTDQHLITEMVRLTLNHGVFETRVTKHADDAWSVIKKRNPQRAVVDMDSGGDHVLRRLVTEFPGQAPCLPILALTGRDDLRTKLAAFDHGVDNYMTIPISPGELLARIIVITRRSIGRSVPINPVIWIGEMEINILHRQMRAGTSELQLTGLEQSLLYFLAANAGEIVTREEILDALWGVDFVAESNVVDRYVRSLRIKLQNDWRKPRFIKTVPGQDYRYIPIFTEQQTGSQAEPAV
jgi:two-component system response regulator ArlR